MRGEDKSDETAKQLSLSIILQLSAFKHSLNDCRATRSSRGGKVAASSSSSIGDRSERSEASSSETSSRRRVSSSAAAAHAAPVQIRHTQQQAELSQSELNNLVDRNLSSSGGGVWSTRRAMVQFNKQAIRNALPGPDDDSIKLAERVGQLAAVNSFDEALKIVENLSKQNTADALSRYTSCAL